MVCCSARPALSLVAWKHLVEPPERMNAFFPTNLACRLTVHVSGLTMNRQTHLGFECFYVPHTFGLGRDGGFLSILTRGSENFWGRPMGACSSRLRRARQQALRNWCRLVHKIWYLRTLQERFHLSGVVLQRFGRPLLDRLSRVWLRTLL